jgi:hypothetical protein
MKKAKKIKLYGLRRYWPNLSVKEAEAARELLSKAQAGKCAICGKHESEFKNRLAVDHNHKTGLVRGLLCYRCNKFVVGRHTFESALKLIRYLKIERKKAT